MIIETRDFGQVEVTDKDILYFPDGIIGFEEYKKYTLLGNEKAKNPFMWLQSVEAKDISFIVIDPLYFKKDYSPEIDEYAIKELKVENKSDIKYLVVVVIPEDISKMTANLKGPIVINAKKNIAKQIILDKGDYKIKHYIVEEMQKGA